LAIFAPARDHDPELLVPRSCALHGGTELDYGVMGAVLLPLALVLSLVLVVGALADRSVVGVAVVPGCSTRCLQRRRPTMLFGFHYWVHGIVAGASNSRIYNLLFGDSSAIVHYLTLIVWNLKQDRATGSNFGTNQKTTTLPVRDRQQHDGVGRAVDDERRKMSSTSFTLSQVKIGDRNYPLGTTSSSRPAARTGTDCLLGPKVMIPIDGVVREGVRLLDRRASRSRVRSSATGNFNTRWRWRRAKSGSRRRTRTTSRTVGRHFCWATGVRLRHAVRSLTRAVLLYPRHGLASLSPPRGAVTGVDPC